MLPFKDVLGSAAKQKFIAFVDSQNPLHLKSVARSDGEALVLIGPEGDFSPEELQSAQDHGFQKVSLGSNRLRTETAGLTACHILNLINS
jgi:16S rRNA (uracil1498-N3)-methyltransferase